MLQSRPIGLSIVIVLLLFMVRVSSADEQQTRSGAYSLLVENDIITGSDDNYTNGIGISWTSAETSKNSPNSFNHRWNNFWSFLPGVDDTSGGNYLSWTLGQEMHTPDDILATRPPPDDQPYAGVLYLDSDIQTHKGDWSQSWHLRIGVVGPAAGAGEIQRWVHRNVSADVPRGWDTQLPNELILNVGFTGVRRVYERNLTASINTRLISLFNFELGNYSTALSAGGLVEVGKNLSSAMSLNALGQGLNTAMVANGRTNKNWSWAAFFGVGATLYGHFLPLDGTVLRNSHSVDTNPLVGFGATGFSLRRGQFAMSLAFATFTETFTTERENLDYGILSFVWYQ